jgi:hypothetical protein
MSRVFVGLAMWTCMPDCSRTSANHRQPVTGSTAA